MVAVKKAPQGLDFITADLRPLAVPIGDLVADPANARLHDEANLAAIRGSLRAYGQRRPAVYRRDNRVVIAGNGMLLAAISLGWTHLAALAVDDDAATAAGYAIADNRTAELASWDDDTLDQLLRQIDTDDEDLQAMFASLAEQQDLEPLGDILPAEGGMPDMPSTDSHQIVIRYQDSDIPALKAFVQRDELSPTKLGAWILERIQKASAH